MLCDNCGKREANVRYSENINGRRKELNLCEECSKKLGIGEIDFSMPINFSSFLGGFMDELESPSFMPMFNTLQQKNKCNHCGSTFEDILNTGMLGCEECYDSFGDELDSIIKKVQGSNRHVGRIGKVIDKKIEEKHKENTSEKVVDKEIILKRDLEQAIKEERYEDAAKIRDELKALENDNKNNK